MNPYKPHLTPGSKDLATRDSFVNFAARLGLGTNTQATASQYGFHPISRNRLQVEWCYRGSWIAGMVVDAIAEDMTREGIEIHGDDTPEDLQQLDKEVDRLQIWDQLAKTIKWSRLYGGAIAVMMIDGQKTDTPLRLDTISKGQFKGLLPLDRWALQPSLANLVSDFGPNFGKPEWYDTVVDINSGLPRMKIHHSRCIRLEGVELPYWQRISENLWGQSVLERLWDRLVAFDSATQGASQMVYKAHLRTYAVDRLREILAAGGDAMDGLLQQISMMRLFQSNEGITLMDATDKFETHQYAFSGLSDLIMQFGQQLSGAAQIPLVRLFGQSPAGLSATGESDLRTYYDGVKQQQEARLRPGIEPLYHALYRSKFGRDPPKVFEISFKPLWQMDDEQNATVVNTMTAAIVTAFEAKIIDRPTAMKELRKMSSVTGVYSNISDDDVRDAEQDPAPTPEALGLELPQKVLPGQEGAGKEDKGGKNLRVVKNA